MLSSLLGTAAKAHTDHMSLTGLAINATDHLPSRARHHTRVASPTATKLSASWLQRHSIDKLPCVQGYAGVACSPLVVTAAAFGQLLKLGFDVSTLAVAAFEGPQGGDQDVILFAIGIECN